MIKKIIRNFPRLIRLTPADNRLPAIIRAISVNELSVHSKNKMRIAVQGVEDPLFFGLFALLLADLRRGQEIIGDLLQIRSISGAVGVGVSAKQARSWLIARLFNDQWARVNRNLIGPVAYRSQPIFWNLGRLKDRRYAQKLWGKMKMLGCPDQLYAQDIQIGDLVIDSYLRFRPSPRFDVHDPFVFTIIQQAVRDLTLAHKYFLTKKPDLYLSSYTTYIEHGIPVRVALKYKVPVRVYGNLIKFGKKISPESKFHTADTSQYKKIFYAYSSREQRAALELAEINLNHRLSGGIDVATSYMKNSAYASSSEPVPDVKGAVVIFLHDFYDSPHIYHDLVFIDFWAWICFTIEALSDAGIPFWIKPHPNQISLSEGVLVDLRQRFPLAQFLSSSITNARLVQAGILCGVTVYGTVAHELAYLGVSVIASARHPHSSFDFCRTAKTIEEYKQMLLSPDVLPATRAEMRQQSLAFYYMHNLSGTVEERELRAAYAILWNVCNAGKGTPEDVAGAIANLKGLPGWEMHLEEIRRDLKKLSELK